MRKRSILILSVLFTFTSFAQERSSLQNESEFLAKVEKKSNTTNSISASFTEEKFLSFMNEPQKSEGIFYYQKQDKMKWEQQKPFSYIILMNSGKVRIQDNGKEKNTTGAGKMMGKVNELMISMINGEIYKSDLFDITYFQTKTDYIAVMVPKNKRIANVYNKIEMAFNKASMSLAQLIFFENTGDKSVMKFKNEKINTTIPTSTFTTF